MTSSVSSLPFRHFAASTTGPVTCYQALFHRVIPSLPGYGYSGKPREVGWDRARIARTWVVLMKRLGYPQFASQGGDWGGAVTNAMGQRTPDGPLGIHVNFTQMIPPDAAKAP